MLSICPEMNTCIKFMDENMQLCENSIDFLHDQQDFLVIGCLGAQGVGKSAIMSQLTSLVCIALICNMLLSFFTEIDVTLIILFYKSGLTFLKRKIYHIMKVVQIVPLE